MRKIIFLITDLDLGGSPLVVRRLAWGLAKSGTWQPTVVSLATPGVVGRWIRTDGVPVVGLHARGPRDGAVLRRWLGVLQAIQPDVVMSVLIHANVIAAIGSGFGPRCSYFQSIHTLAERPVWHWQAQSVIAGQCAAVIAPSRFILQRISNYGGVPPGVVIPNGIEVECFAKAMPIEPALRPWPADALVVGYVGRFDPVKRLPVLLTAAAALIHADEARWRHLHVAMVGYGRQDAYLRELAEKLGIATRVHFTGATTAPQHWYKAMDVLCMPSLSEGFGLNMVEAMAAGTPVLAFDTPAVREVVTHCRTGWLVDPARTGSLAEGLAVLLEDSSFRGQLGNMAAQEAAQRFSAVQMVEKYKKIFGQT